MASGGQWVRRLGALEGASPPSNASLPYRVPGVESPRNPCCIDFRTTSGQLRVDYSSARLSEVICWDLQAKCAPFKQSTHQRAKTLNHVRMGRHVQILRDGCIPGHSSPLRGGGGGVVAWDPPGPTHPPTHPHTHSPTHSRTFSSRKKMNFVKGARNWRSILGTQTLFFWPLTPPLPPPPAGTRKIRHYAVACCMQRTRSRRVRGVVCPLGYSAAREYRKGGRCMSKKTGSASEGSNFADPRHQTALGHLWFHARPPPKVCTSPRQGTATLRSRDA